MKIKRQVTSTRKKVTIAVIFIVLVIAVSIGFFVYKNQTRSNKTVNSSINYKQATNAQKSAGSNTKANSVDANGGAKSSTSGSDQAASPVPQANGKGKVDATLTAADQNGSVLQIRFDIGAVTANGTCTLTLQKGTTTVTRSSDVQALAGSSTCKGFDIPVSDLSAGTWQISLHFENNDLVADTTGSTIVQ